MVQISLTARWPRKLLQWATVPFQSIWQSHIMDTCVLPKIGHCHRSQSRVPNRSIVWHDQSATKLAQIGMILPVFGLSHVFSLFRPSATPILIPIHCKIAISHPHKCQNFHYVTVMAHLCQITKLIQCVTVTRVCRNGTVLPKSFWSQLSAMKYV